MLAARIRASAQQVTPKFSWQSPRLQHSRRASLQRAPPPSPAVPSTAPCPSPPFQPACTKHRSQPLLLLGIKLPADRPIFLAPGKESRAQTSVSKRAAQGLPSHALHMQVEKALEVDDRSTRSFHTMPGWGLSASRVTCMGDYIWLRPECRRQQKASRASTGRVGHCCWQATGSYALGLTAPRFRHNWPR